MGDRCYIQMTVHNYDQLSDKTKEEIDNLFVRENGEDSPEFHAEEANYAYYDELQDLATEGVIATGWHGAGGDYAAEDFVLHDGKVYNVPEGGPFSPVDRQGNVLPTAIDAAIEYWQAFDAATEGEYSTPAPHVG